MRRIVLLAALATAGCSSKEVDVDLGKNTNSEYFLIPDTIREADGKTSATVISEELPDSDRNKEARSKGLAEAQRGTAMWVFDCDRRTIEIIHHRLQLSNGETFTQDDIPPTLAEANSMGEEGMKFACMPGWKRWVANHKSN